VTRALFVVAVTACWAVGGWAAVAVLALCRVGARWHPQEVTR
jgi:hypothetical protein